MSGTIYDVGPSKQEIKVDVKLTHRYSAKSSRYGLFVFSSNDDEGKEYVYSGSKKVDCSMGDACDTFTKTWVDYVNGKKILENRVVQVSPDLRGKKVYVDGKKPVSVCRFLLQRVLDQMLVDGPVDGLKIYASSYFRSSVICYCKYMLEAGFQLFVTPHQDEYDYEFGDDIGEILLNDGQDDFYEMDINGRWQKEESGDTLSFLNALSHLEKGTLPDGGKRHIRNRNRNRNATTEAVYDDDVEKLEMLVQTHGTDLLFTEYEYFYLGEYRFYTPIEIAILHNSAKVFEYLLSLFEIKEYERKEPLIFSVVEYDRPDLLEVLLKKGVDVNEKNEQNETALAEAVFTNKPEIVEMLLQKDDIVLFDDEKRLVLETIRAGQPKSYLDRVLFYQWASPERYKRAESIFKSLLSAYWDRRDAWSPENQNDTYGNLLYRIEGHPNREGYSRVFKESEFSKEWESVRAVTAAKFKAKKSRVIRPPLEGGITKTKAGGHSAGLDFLLELGLNI